MSLFAFWIPHQGKSLPSFSPISRKAYVELRVGKSWRHTCSSCVAKSKTGSSRRNKSQTLIKMCKCVEFLWMVNELLSWAISLLFLWTWANFLLKHIGPSCVKISFLSLLNTLDLHVSNFFSLSFFNSPCLCNLERIAMINMEFIFCGMEWAKCSCATPDVEVGKYMWSVRDLDHGSMKCISQRVTTINKAQRDNRLHM